MGYIFYQVIELSVSSILLIGIVMILRFLLKNSPKWIMGVLWGIVALKLVLPFQFSRPSFIGDSYRENLVSSFGLDNEYDINMGVIELYEPIRTINVVTEKDHNNSISEQDEHRINVNDNTEAKSVPQNNDTKGSITDCFFIVWMLGWVSMLSYAIYSYILIKRKTRVFIKIGDGIRECDEIDTPFIIGIIKPIIFIPSGYDEGIIHNVILHEQAHIKRLDYIRKQIAFLILSIHWFNPLIWLSYELFCRDIELACDEKTVKNMTVDERKSYASALLSCSTRTRMKYVCPVAFGKIGVRVRIKQIFNYKKTTTWSLIITPIVCVVLLLLFFSKPIIKESAARSDQSESFVNNITSQELIKNINNDSTIETDDYNINHYYNISVRKCLNKTFIESDDGIYVVEEGESEFRKILDSGYILGAVDDNGIYVCKLSENSQQCLDLLYSDAETYKLSLLDENINICNSNGIMHYAGMCIQDGKLYIEGDDRYVIYEIVSKDKVIFKGEIKKEGFRYFPIATYRSVGLEEAELNNMDSLLVGDLNVKKGNGETSIDESVRDIILMPDGAIVRRAKSGELGSDNDVYLFSFENDTNTLIYNSEEHGGLAVGYSTYDQNGFYGLQIYGDNSYKIVFCSWSGIYKELYNFKTSYNIVATQLRMGIVNEWLYFMDPSDGCMKRINTENETIQIIQ